MRCWAGTAKSRLASEVKCIASTSKTWVLRALLIWQLLNKTAALQAGIDVRVYPPVSDHWHRG